MKSRLRPRLAVHGLSAWPGGRSATQRAGANRQNGPGCPPWPNVRTVGFETPSSRCAWQADGQGVCKTAIGELPDMPDLPGVAVLRRKLVYSL